MLSVKQRDIKYRFLSPWYVSQAFGEHSMGHNRPMGLKLAPKDNKLKHDWVWKVIDRELSKKIKIWPHEQMVCGQPRIRIG